MPTPRSRDRPPAPETAPPPRRPAVDAARMGLRLGLIGFGGPAAHIGLLEDDVVRRRGWLPRHEFLDLVAASTVLPGPSSVELVALLGARRAGRAGLVAAAFAFVGPAVALAAAVGAVYAAWGELPAVRPWLRGVPPVVLAVVLGALVRLGRGALRDRRRAAIALAVALAVLLGLDEVLALVAGALAGAWGLAGSREDGPPPGRGAPGIGAGMSVGLASRPAFAAAGAAAGGAAVLPAWRIGLFFLRVGAVLYGGGYVLVAFLQGGLVEGLGVLDEATVLDALAVGQLTPGPLLCSATFVGWILAGPAGAAAATAGIFFPAFVYAAIAGRVLPALRRGQRTSGLLDGAQAGAVGLLVVAAASLGRAALADPVDWALAAGAAAVLATGRLGPGTLVLAGSAAGRLLA